MCIWARNFKDPQGIAGFEVDLKYNNNIFHMTGASGNATLLVSTGRPAPAPPCTPSIIEAIPNYPQGWWHADITCTTLGLGPPFTFAGPLGKGLLGTFMIQPNTLIASTPMQDRNTALFDAGESYDNNQDGDVEDIGIDVIVDRASIPFSAMLIPGVTVAPCADFPIAGNPPDGAVSIGDIVELVKHFGENSGSPGWNPVFDLDANNSISIADVVIGVKEFGSLCPT